MNENTESSIITISLQGFGSDCCQGLITKECYDVFKNKYYNTELIDNGWSDFLEKELQLSKNYKSELKWFEGAWSRFKPGLGKDKRGASGVKKDTLIKFELL